MPIPFIAVCHPHPLEHYKASIRNGSQKTISPLQEMLCIIAPTQIRVSCSLVHLSRITPIKHKQVYGTTTHPQRQLSTSHLMFTQNDPLTRECPTKGDRYRTSIAPAEMPYITRGVRTKKTTTARAFQMVLKIFKGFKNCRSRNVMHQINT
jgi:hypothetical protein